MVKRKSGTKRELAPSSVPVDGGDDLSMVRHFVWTVGSIGVHLYEIQHVWAKTLGISAPQWMILMALSDFDKGQGVPVNEVAKVLHVDPSFVTTQSKLLEKKGFVRRKASDVDARIVRMSLTDKTCKQLSNLCGQQEALYEFVFSGLSGREFEDLLKGLSLLKSRLQKASIMAGLEVSK